MSKTHFRVSVNAADRYRWQLVHDNGNILAGSGEGYASKRKAEQDIKSVKRNMSDADVIEAWFRGSNPRFA